MTILQKHLVFIPVFLVVMVTLIGALVMWLWNWLMPSLFGLPTLTFWQAVGLLVLCRLLVGNIGFGGHHHGHEHGDCGSSNKLRERWNNMSAEERQHVIENHGADDPKLTADEGR